MWLICGLGNFGSQYDNTRHNIGFLVLDKIASKFNTTFSLKTKFKGESAKIIIDDQDAILLKPHTYMNLSGNSIASVLNYYKISLNNLIVIHDDLDLELGKFRIKLGGGSGGHNGIKSIDNLIGNLYLRIKIGIGKPKGYDASNYVLGQISKEELALLHPSINGIVENLGLLLKKELNVFFNAVIKYINNEVSIL